MAVADMLVVDQSSEPQDATSLRCALCAAACCGALPHVERYLAMYSAMLKYAPMFPCSQRSGTTGTADVAIGPAQAREI